MVISRNFGMYLTQACVGTLAHPSQPWRLESSAKPKRLEKRGGG